MEGREKKTGTGPRDNWVKMPRELTLSNELNPYQYRVLAILLDRDNLHQGTKGKTWFYCYLGWITDHSGIGETKVKQSLKELEKMGFISITRNKDTRLANRFHINWDYIKAYKRPLTQKELEGMEDPDALEEELIAQGETASAETAIIPFNCEEFDVDMSVEEEYRRQHSPEPPKQAASAPVVSSTPVLTSTLPSAKTWVQTAGKDILYEEWFPFLAGHIPQGGGSLPGGVIDEVMVNIMPMVADKDKYYVWEKIITPEFKNYLNQPKKRNENI